MHVCCQECGRRKTGQVHRIETLRTARQRQRLQLAPHSHSAVGLCRRNVLGVALQLARRLLDHIPIMTSLSKPSASSRVKRKLADISVDVVWSHSSPRSSLSPSSTSSEPSSESESESKDSPVRGVAPDEPQVLSHAEKRRQKKRKLNSGDAEPIDASSEFHINSTSTPSKAKKKAGKKGNRSGDSAPESSDALPKRQNSVWVGNLAYKTTAASLKNFFGELEVTRIHMPLKASPSGGGPNANSG